MLAVRLAAPWLVFVPLTSQHVLAEALYGTSQVSINVVKHLLIDGVRWIILRGVFGPSKPMHMRGAAMLELVPIEEVL
jgi:hypothetical protein